MTTKKLTYYLYIFILLLPLAGFGQKYTDLEVKAGYLVNIPSFVVFPINSDREQIALAVYGKNPFGDLLEIMLAAKKGRRPKLIILKTFDELINTRYNVLFIGEIPRVELLKVLEFTKERSILTVANNVPDFCEEGGILNFEKLPQEKIFSINHTLALMRGIVIDPKLLVLAKIVNH